MAEDVPEALDEVTALVTTAEELLAGAEGLKDVIEQANKILQNTASGSAVDLLEQLTTASASAVERVRELATALGTITNAG